MIYGREPGDRVVDLSRIERKLLRLVGVLHLGGSAGRVVRSVVEVYLRLAKLDEAGES